VLHSLENSNSFEDIDDIRQELAEQGYLPSKKKRPEKKNSKNLLLILTSPQTVFISMWEKTMCKMIF